MIKKITILLLISYNCSGQYYNIKKVQVQQLPFSEKEYYATQWFTKSNETSISRIIDSYGNYVIEDSYEGSNSGYYFYTKEGKLINKYRPFTFFNDYVYDFDEKQFVVAAFRGHSSDTIKLGLLNHQGNLISEKLVINSKKNLWLSKIRIANNFIILLLNDSNQMFYIKAYDNQLNEIWTKQLKSFLFYDGVSIDKEKNCLFISSKRELSSLDLISGNTNWSIKPFENNDSTGAYQTSLLFGGKLIGLYKFKLIEDKKHNFKIINSNLELHNSKSGKLIYQENFKDTESLKDTDSDLSFYNNLYPNIDISEFYFKRDGIIWKYYIE